MAVFFLHDLKSLASRVSLVTQNLPLHFANPGFRNDALRTISSDMLSIDPHLKVIIITGRGEKDHALRAVAEGAYDFMYKPVQIDELKVVIKRALYVSSLEREHHQLEKQLGEDSFEGMLGTSARCRMFLRPSENWPPPTCRS